MTWFARGADRRAIAHHYDLSNDFYALFLDRRMVYTCAWYRAPDVDLDTAQEDKLELVCRKLDLRPGARLLDVGCGWGGLLLWAARHHGVEGVGVTLSVAQAAFAEEAIRREGLERRLRVVLADWRSLPPAAADFDAVAAVGLLEHVGIAATPLLLATTWRCLRPGGRLLVQAISRDVRWRPTSLQRFLDRHVFPRGELQAISTLAGEVERARFALLDVEGLGEHYARTTRQWAERLRARADEARALVGERTYRVWLAYLVSASVAFAQGSIGLYQTLATKPAGADAARSPRTRAAWYAPTPLPPLERAG
ncbi:MAG: class I SAM-dependent methyltransferase [bacterium]|nr:class I SAM-dependent methyltransferase [bacterium]